MEPSISVLERVSCSYFIGRPVRVVRVSEGGGEVGVRVVAMDIVSSAGWAGVVIVIVFMWGLQFCDERELQQRGGLMVSFFTQHIN